MNPLDPFALQTAFPSYAAHPERFHSAPVPPPLPDKAWINEPQPSTIETTEDQHATNAA